MTTNISQRELIHEYEWDYLLVLDCFRYDAFSELYDQYLDVDTEPLAVRSAGSHTIHWLAETWPDEYPDVTYVSGHALINSDGIPGLYAARQEAIENGVNGEYIPAEHFPDIIDVWDSGYMSNIETVPPWAINEALTRDAEPPAIGHYVQPHFPWVRGHQYAEKHDLPTTDGYREEWTPEPTGGRGPQFRRGWVFEHLGMDGVRMAYKDNCRVALDGVSDVLAELDGTVIITSDHGELFEEGVTHPPGSNHPELRTVPWLEVHND